ncbi:MAG: hypothetical protein IJW37_00220, partial [Lachnospiraceae bacterium]|nr:hypothetical protein [Lachnospiraceae bacterium]
EQALSLGYEYIYSEILDFNAIYAMDLDKFVEITNGVEDKYKKGTFWETFEEYYVDTTRRAILMEYLTEECLIYRDLGNIVVYLPVNKKEYPMRALKMDDLKDYESGNIQAYFRTRILAYPENFNNNFSAFDSVADYAKGAGLFD